MTTTLVYPQLIQVSVVAPGVPSSPPPAAVNGSTGAMTDTAAHTIVAAQGAGKKFYCTSIIVTNTSGNASYVTLGGLDSTVAPLIPAPANGGAVIEFEPPLIGAANTAFTATPGVGVTSLNVFANGYNV